VVKECECFVNIYCDGLANLDAFALLIGGKNGVVVVRVKRIHLTTLGVVSEFLWPTTSFDT